MYTKGFFEDFRGLAVLLRGDDERPLCLVRCDLYAGIFRVEKGRSLRDCYAFSTKKNALQFAKAMSFPCNSVVKYQGKLSGVVWGIRYGSYSYLVAPEFAYDKIRNIVLSCKKSHHSWDDGWVCSNCGKKKSDLQEFKWQTPKWVPLTPQS
jgi:hypothetical protein